MCSGGKTINHNKKEEKMKKPILVILVLLLLVFPSICFSSKVVEVPPGTPLSASNLQDIVSGEAAPGDSVMMQVEKDVIVDGFVVIKEGAIVIASISKSREATFVSIGGSLAIAFKTVEAVDGQNIFVGGSVSKKVDQEKAVQTAALSACCFLFALQKGEEQVIKAGHVFNLNTLGRAKIKVN
jgi:hypothetical protein